jgi:hypothetical protein
MGWPGGTTWSTCWRREGNSLMEARLEMAVIPRRSPHGWLECLSAASESRLQMISSPYCTSTRASGRNVCSWVLECLTLDVGMLFTPAHFGLVALWLCRMRPDPYPFSGIHALTARPHSSIRPQACSARLAPSVAISRVRSVGYPIAESALSDVKCERCGLRDGSRHMAVGGLSIISFSKRLLTVCTYEMIKLCHPEDSSICPNIHIWQVDLNSDPGINRRPLEAAAH